MNKKKKFNLKKHYRSSWNYIKECRHFLYYAFILFFVFFLIGFFIPAHEYIHDMISSFLMELIEKTQGLSYGGLLFYIFFNNIQSSFFGMIMGIFAGIFPMISILANGYILGFVSALSVKSEGILVLWRIFPHGIFELPALFISLGLGMKLGSILFEKSKNKMNLIKENLKNSLEVFVFIVMPLLILATIIETSLIFIAG